MPSRKDLDLVLVVNPRSDEIVPTRNEFSRRCRRIRTSLRHFLMHDLKRGVDPPVQTKTGVLLR